MAGTSGMNIVLGQGSAIKELHNVRRQSLDMNQQFVAQNMDEKKKEGRQKVEEFEDGHKIETKDDQEEGGEGGLRHEQKGKERKQGEGESGMSQGNLIDIRV